MNVIFKTATDFRRSLEARLKTISIRTGEDLQRLRRRVAFDRFLARVFSVEESGFCLKGGYAMELRLAEARTTKDIDLTCLRRIKDEKELLAELILQDLQNLARIDLQDHFVYQIGRVQMDLENAPYGGARYPVLSLVDGRLFVRFQLDIGADIITDKIENIKGADWLEFCGVSSPIIPMISMPQQFAEKLHAYTLPRDNRFNSRVKDLVDLMLLLKMKKQSPEAFYQALQRVFKTRNTHSLPERLNPPPFEWESPFSAMAKECSLSKNMQESFKEIEHFYQKIINLNK